MNNFAASVRARLLNVAKAQGVDFNQVLVRFALERILGSSFEPSNSLRLLLTPSGPSPLRGDVLRGAVLRLSNPERGLLNPPAPPIPTKKATLRQPHLWVLVEPAGIEPASVSNPLTDLHV